MLIMLLTLGSMLPSGSREYILGHALYLYFFGFMVKLLVVGVLLVDVLVHHIWGFAWGLGLG